MRRTRCDGGTHTQTQRETDPGGPTAYLADVCVAAVHLALLRLKVAVVVEDREDLLPGDGEADGAAGREAVVVACREVSRGRDRRRRRRVV